MSTNRNFVSLLSGNLIAQLIPFLFAPILSRIYSVNDFAFQSYFFALLGFATVIGTAGYEDSIFIENEKSKRNKLVVLCIYILTLISLLSSVILGLFCFFEEINSIFFLLPICIFGFTLNRIFEKYHNKIKNYRIISTQKILKSIIEVFVNLIGFFNELKYYNLITGFIIATLYSSYFYYTKMKDEVSKSFLIVNKDITKNLIKEYRKFPLLVLPNQVLIMFSSQLPFFLIPMMYSYNDLGYYSFGIKYFQAPLGLVSAVLYNILYQEFSEVLYNFDFIKNKVLYYLKIIVPVSIILMVLSLCFDDLFSFVFGAKWGLSGHYIFILMPYILLRFIYNIFSMLPVLLNKQKIALNFEIALFFTSIGPFFLTELPFETCLYLYSAFNSILLFIFMFWFGYNYVRNLANSNEG
jgi:O-antigen/teichoic acid export membrane protein